MPSSHLPILKTEKVDLKEAYFMDRIYQLENLQKINMRKYALKYDNISNYWVGIWPTKIKRIWIKKEKLGCDCY